VITRIKRAWSGRPARKFRRNRLAVAALAVIGLYVLIGGWVMACDLARTLGASTGWWEVPDSGWVHFFTVQRADSEVAPLETTGWFEGQKPEKRLQDAKFYLDEFRKAIRQSNPKAALERIRLGERRVDVSGEDAVGRVKATLAEARTLYDDISRSPDLNAEPAHAAPGAGGDASDGSPPGATLGVAARLDELDRKLGSLFRPLTAGERVRQGITMSLGTDRDGRSIMMRAVYSVKVAIQVGLVVGLVSVVIGSLLGAGAAYFGGWVDHAVVWLYSTLSSLPDLVLLAVLVFAFTGSVFDDVTKPWLSLVPLYCAMCATFWIGPCRVIRGEVLKIKQLEYIQAATAVGFGRFYILVKHAIPNTLHIMFINFSLLFIAAIKNEVVLSFLGLGVKVGPSWGRMIQESAAQVINGFFWQIGAATAFMFFLVLAFNVLSDALQDAFDPRHVG
jgi:peptide/nickel transport system permease protein